MSKAFCSVLLNEITMIQFLYRCYLIVLTLYTSQAKAQNCFRIAAIIPLDVTRRPTHQKNRVEESEWLIAY